METPTHTAPPVDLHRLVRVVRQRQNDPNNQLASIRYLSRRMEATQQDVLNACEDAELNINVGVGCGNGIYVEERIGDYTVEDLSSYANSVISTIQYHQRRYYHTQNRIYSVAQRP